MAINSKIFQSVVAIGGTTALVVGLGLSVIAQHNQTLQAHDDFNRAGGVRECDQPTVIKTAGLGSETVSVEICKNGVLAGTDTYSDGSVNYKIDTAHGTFNSVWSSNDGSSIQSNFGFVNDDSKSQYPGLVAVLDTARNGRTVLSAPVQP
jgi:hypothetical protein